jgi:Bacterial membrane protein YfhO
MRDAPRADLAARVFLTLGALLPYWRLLTFSVVFVTDDYFASDIFNGELPGRVLIGQLIRHGQFPVWTNQLCSGLSLTGSVADPIGLAPFILLPPAPALDLFVIVLLLVAAHGAYGLARRFGADRIGAVLAGIAFAGSGYIACQLKHLSIVSTVVWLPVGLLLIDRVLGADTGVDGRPTTNARRALFMALFGLVFAEQVLSGFPQSAYICALFYGAFALFCAGRRHAPARATGDRKPIGSIPLSLALLAGLGLAIGLGAAAGAVVLVPLSELGSVSDRSEPLGYLWSTALAYWPPNILTFLVPYINGDISDNSFIGHPFFWEDYGYVGLATFLLALYGAVRERRRPLVVFAIAMTVLAYLLVLGSATPVYRVAYELVPGLKLFRFPTRFLIVVELGIALLGAVGLTRLRADLERRWKPPSRIPHAIVLALCAATALDLFIHQPRQNPMVPAAPWLAPPPSVHLINAGTSPPRTFTPRHRELHRRTFQTARGWADVGPYFAARDLLEPNTGGGYWNTPSADCYAGIAPRWYVDVWGDHSREAALVALLAGYDHDAKILQLYPAFPKVMKMYGVSHVLSPYPQQGTAFQLAGYDGHAYVYNVPGASRVRFVRAARHVTTDQETAKRLLDFSFDPDREILLNDAPDSIHPTVDEIEIAPGDTPAAGGRAVITREDSRQIVIDAEAPANGFLLLADTFYPGWTATVDGTRTPIYRANHSVRGIQLPRGRHEVRFSYDAPGYIRGLQITLLSMSLLLLWAGGAAYAGRRASGGVSAAIR